MSVSVDEEVVTGLLELLKSIEKDIRIEFNEWDIRNSECPRIVDHLQDVIYYINTLEDM